MCGLSCRRRLRGHVDVYVVVDAAGGAGGVLRLAAPLSPSADRCGGGDGGAPWRGACASLPGRVVTMSVGGAVRWRRCHRAVGFCIVRRIGMASDRLMCLYLSSSILFPPSGDDDDAGLFVSLRRSRSLLRFGRTESSRGRRRRRRRRSRWRSTTGAASPSSALSGRARTRHSRASATKRRPAASPSRASGTSCASSRGTRPRCCARRCPARARAGTARARACRS